MFAIQVYIGLKLPIYDLWLNVREDIQIISSQLLETIKIYFISLERFIMRTGEAKIAIVCLKELRELHLISILLTANI